MSAVEIVRLLDRLTSVKTDAHSQWLICGLVVLGKRALDGDGTLEGAPGAAEGDHEAVPLRLHLVALVGLKLLPGQGVVLS